MPTLRPTHLNDRDIDPVRDAHLRKMENVFSSNATGRVGVLELSTGNVKLLVGPERVPDRFDFADFCRQATRCRPAAGDLLDGYNVMDMGRFARHIMPTISFYARLARGDWPEPWGVRDPDTGAVIVDRRKDFAVDRLCAVATAAYRTAANRDEIVRAIALETGIDVCLLTRDEEARAAMTAFRRTAPNPELLAAAARVLLVDQGAGSTEVSLHDGDVCRSCSLDLGRVVLSHVFTAHADDPFRGLAEADKLMEQRLRDGLRGWPLTPAVTLAIAVGSAITEATGLPRSADHHGVTLTAGRLRQLIDDSEALLLCGRFATRDEFRRAMTLRMGLKVYDMLMEHFGVSRVTVSGTPLWYGVYYGQAARSDSRLVDKKAR